jgi:hypothetical protein
LLTVLCALPGAFAPIGAKKTALRACKPNRNGGLLSRLAVSLFKKIIKKGATKMNVKT